MLTFQTLTILFSVLKCSERTPIMTKCFKAVFRRGVVYKIHTKKVKLISFSANFLGLSTSGASTQRSQLWLILFLETNPNPQKSQLAGYLHSAGCDKQNKWMKDHSGQNKYRRNWDFTGWTRELGCVAINKWKRLRWAFVSYEMCVSGPYCYPSASLGTSLFWSKESEQVRL